MTAGDAALLGIVQGVTEFLPISSSGHLVIAQDLMGVSSAGILFEVVVHLGTLASILVVFREDIGRLLRHRSSRESKKMFVHLLIGTIPIALAGVLFKSQIEMTFNNLHLVGSAFLATGIMLILTYFTASRSEGTTPKKSVFIGLSQALALIPGISRSGATISTGLFLGIDAKEAARFSFLLAIPALFGSGVYMMREFVSLGAGSEGAGVLAAGFVSSFIVGLVSLKFLLRVLVRGRFHWFGIYCLAVGIMSIGR